MTSKYQSVNLICDCKEETSLQYVTAAPGCSNDFAAVSVLPEDWIPRKGGPILANYLKQQEQSHQTVFDALLKDIQLSNEEIDCKVRIIAEIFLNEIQQNKLDIDCAVEKSNSSINSIMTDELQTKITEINSLLTLRIQNLTKFKLEALALEKNRASKLKKTLQLHFHKFVNVGYKSPKQLLREFDERIYGINQQLMSNYRTYMILEAKLRSQVDESLTQAHSKLNQMFLVLTIERRQCTLSQKEENKQNSLCRFDQHIGHNYEIKPYPNLLEGYSETVLKLFSAISNKFDELHKDIADRNLTVLECNSPMITDLQNTISNVIDTLGSLLCDVLFNFFNTLSCNYCTNMQKALSNLSENFKNLFTILYGASHLCDAHNVRFNLAQKLTLTSLEDLMVNNDLTQFANEVVNNIAIEHIRTASDADKLQQSYDGVVVALNRAFDLYKQQGEIEVCKLDEISNLVPSLANTLSGEHNCFLVNNIETAEPQLELKSESFNQLDNILTLSPLFLCSAIFQTELQNNFLRKSKQKFLESIENNISKIPYQTNQESQRWVHKKKDMLHMRHSLKALSNSIRKERINTARAMRLNEINYHEARLNSHLEAIYELVNNLPVDALQCFSLDSPELYPLGMWLSGMQNDMNRLFALDSLDTEVKILKMYSYGLRLSNYRKYFLESLDLTLEQYENDVKSKVQLARMSNVRFMTQLKLFSEGGRYAASEAMKACTDLIKGADALEASLNKTLDCINVRRTELINHAEQQIIPIQKLVDETLKNTPKLNPDKKKPNTGKKKKINYLRYQSRK